MLFEAIGRSLIWVHLLVWPAFQVTALLALRGRSRTLSAYALIPMALVVLAAYDDFAHPERFAGLMGLFLLPLLLVEGKLGALPLGWLALNVCCPIAAAWNWFCIGRSDATAAKKKTYVKRAFLATAVLFAATVVASASIIKGRSEERARQELAAEVILSGVPPRVLVGPPAGKNPTELQAMGAQRALEAANADLRGCYESALRAEPAASGEMIVDIAVRPDGRVAKTTAQQSNAATDAESCILTRLAALRFDPRDSTSSISFTVRVQLVHPLPDKLGDR